MKILVSAGHSTVPPVDPGVCNQRYKESELALDLRDDVAVLLQNLGFQVIEDGVDGVSEPLNKAINLARTADLAVEFHFNGGPPTATGIEVLCKPKHKETARQICAGIKRATGLMTRGGEDGYRPDNSGQHHRLGFCEAGGLIVEVCFLSNQKDLDAFLNNRKAVATEIANAIATAMGGPAAVQSPAKAPTTYKVANGDTLSRIAAKTGVSMADLIRFNNIGDPDKISAGQDLILR